MQETVKYDKHYEMEFLIQICVSLIVMFNLKSIDEDD